MSNAGHDDSACLVCFELFDLAAREPRVLVCGHSICTSCCGNISIANNVGPQFGKNIDCPVCRNVGTYPDLPPINFAVRNLIESRKEGPTPIVQCMQCNSRKPIDDIMACKDEHYKLLCVVCALTQHRDHHLITYREYHAIQLCADAKGNLSRVNDELRSTKNAFDQSFATLVDIFKTIRLNMSTIRIPEDLQVAAAKVKEESEAEAVREKAEKLLSDVTSALQPFHDAIKKAIEEGEPAKTCEALIGPPEPIKVRPREARAPTSGDHRTFTEDAGRHRAGQEHAKGSRKEPQIVNEFYDNCDKNKADAKAAISGAPAAGGTGQPSAANPQAQRL